MVHPQHRSRLLYALLMSTALFSFVACFRHVHKEQAQHLGGLTAGQVIRMSQPICEAIAPQLDRLTLSIEPSQAPLKQWAVLCKDEKSHEFARLVWNADTGQLERADNLVEQQTESAPLQNSPLLNAPEAVTAARSWLGILKVNTPPAEWHLLRPPTFSEPPTCIVLWRTKGLRAVIHLNTHSGRLIYARFWPEQVTSRPVAANASYTNQGYRGGR